MDRTKSEILRYLGRRDQEVPESLDHMIDECIALMRGAAAPRHVSLDFGLSPDGGGVFLTEAALLLPGRDIERHLRGCVRAVLVAATLGSGADSLIRRWEHTDLTRSLILDACATQLIEEYCDNLEQTLRARAAASGLAATARFSPGYGDLPLDVQPQILRALNAERRIGLTCTENFILLPRKSVTALVGLGENLTVSPGGCGNCAMCQTCRFRKDGNTHGCPEMVEK